MRPFAEIEALAIEHKGGRKAMEALITRPKTAKQLAAIGDDRYLSDMTRRVFQAGFNWSVIDSKWPAFEKAFDGFDPRRLLLFNDEDLDRLLKDASIVRHAKKILSVPKNARFLCDLADEHGTAANAFANWPATDHIDLLELIKKHGDRLGGTSGQYFLRGIGKDSFILSKDVSAALIREGITDKPPTSKRDLKATQEAFNTWMGESNKGLTEISRILAMSVG